MEIVDGKLIVNVVPAVLVGVFLVSLLLSLYYFFQSGDSSKSFFHRGESGSITIAGPYEQSLLTTALAATRNGVVITDRAGSILYANRAFSQLTGYTEKEMLGKNPRELVKSGVHGKEFYRELWKTITSGKHWHGEMINRKKDGSLYNEEQTITPVYDTRGHISHFIAVKQDVTIRKELEKDLRLSEEKFRNIFLHHNAIMMLVDPSSGLIIDANQSAVDFYGYERSELCSMYIQDINQLDPEQVAREREKAKNAKRNYFIFPHQLKDGSIRIVEVHSSPISVNQEKLLFSIIHDITERQKLEEKLRQVAITDEMTGLINRRQVFKIGEVEYQRALRHNEKMCVIMLDIDFFKGINDEFGHAAGDFALKEVATCIKSGLREYDTAGRIGGEEFLVILPNTAIDGGIVVAERIRKLIEGSEVNFDTNLIKLSASLGVAQNSSEKIDNFERLVQMADKALYKAKQSGRNRVAT